MENDIVKKEYNTIDNFKRSKTKSALMAELWEKIQVTELSEEQVKNEIKARVSKNELFNLTMITELGIKSSWENVLSVQEQAIMLKNEIDNVIEETSTLRGAGAEDMALANYYEELLSKKREEYLKFVKEHSELLNKLGMKENTSTKSGSKTLNVGSLTVAGGNNKMDPYVSTKPLTDTTKNMTNEIEDF